MCIRCFFRIFMIRKTISAYIQFHTRVYFININNFAIGYFSPAFNHVNTSLPNAFHNQTINHPTFFLLILINPKRLSAQRCNYSFNELLCHLTLMRSGENGLIYELSRRIVNSKEKKSSRLRKLFATYNSSFQHQNLKWMQKIFCERSYI